MLFIPEVVNVTIPTEWRETENLNYMTVGADQKKPPKKATNSKRYHYYQYNKFRN